MFLDSTIRSIACVEAQDLLETWTFDREAIHQENTTYATARNVPLVLHADKWDGFQNLNWGCTTKYPDAEDVLLMNIMTLRHFQPSRQPWRPAFADVNGPLVLKLAVSRDGKHWDRLDRKASVDLGLMNQFDRLRHQPSPAIIRVRNYVSQYVYAGPNLHDPTLLRSGYNEETPEWFDVAMIGIRQRLDGFISADADYKGGANNTTACV